MDSVCIKDFSFAYPGKEANSLFSIDLSLKRGEFTVIAGDSKSGKTSLLYAIYGIIPYFYRGKTKGYIKVNGRDLDGKYFEEVKGFSKIVLQNPYAQISGMSSNVFEEVAIGAKSLSAQQIEKRVYETLELLGIENLSQRDPGTLSGGETQRMIIASQLVADCKILLLDDPASKLDPEGQFKIYEIAEGLAKKGKTVVITSNDMEKAAIFSNRIVVMNKGEIVMDEEAKTAASDPGLGKYGIESLRYTDAAVMGIKEGLWRGEGRLPATLKEAVEGFRQ